MTDLPSWIGAGASMIAALSAASALVLSVRKLDRIHDQFNSRMTEFMAMQIKASLAEGRLEERQSHREIEAQATIDKAAAEAKLLDEAAVRDAATLKPK